MGYTDDLILNSLLKSREDNFGEPDDLIKAMNKAGLVQKEVQVRGKNGQVFTRKQWVKASEDQSTINQTKAQEEQKDKSSEKVTLPHHVTGKNMNELISNLQKIGLDLDSADKRQPQDKVMIYDKNGNAYTATFNKYSDGSTEVINFKPDKSDSGKSFPSQTKQAAESNKDNQPPDASKDGNQGTHDSQKSFSTPKDKQGLVQLLQSGASREDIMAQAEKDGITWKKSDHAGINWMRASMAITGTSTRGDKGSKAQEAQEVQESNPSESENSQVESSQESGKEQPSADNEEQSNEEQSDEEQSDEEQSDEEQSDEDNAPDSIPFSKDDAEDTSIKEFLENSNDEGIKLACKKAGLTDGLILSSDSWGADKIKELCDNSFMVNRNRAGKGVIYSNYGTQFVYLEENGNISVFVPKDAKFKIDDEDIPKETMMQKLVRHSKPKQTSASANSESNKTNYGKSSSGINMDSMLKPKSGEDVKQAMTVHDICTRSAGTSVIDVNRKLQRFCDRNGITDNGGSIVMQPDGKVVATTKDGTSTVIYTDYGNGQGFINSTKKEGAFFSSKGQSLDVNAVKTAYHEMDKKANCDEKGLPKVRKEPKSYEGIVGAKSDGKTLEISRERPSYANPSEMVASSMNAKISKTPPRARDAYYMYDLKDSSGNNYSLFWNNGKAIAVPSTAK